MSTEQNKRESIRQEGERLLSSFNKTIRLQLIASGLLGDQKEDVLPRSVKSDFYGVGRMKVSVEVSPDWNISIMRGKKSLNLSPQENGGYILKNRQKMGMTDIYDTLREVNMQIRGDGLSFRYASGQQKVPENAGVSVSDAANGKYRIAGDMKTITRMELGELGYKF